MRLWWNFYSMKSDLYNDMCILRPSHSDFYSCMSPAHRVVFKFYESVWGSFSHFTYMRKMQTWYTYSCDNYTYMRPRYEYGSLLRDSGYGNYIHSLRIHVELLDSWSVMIYSLLINEDNQKSHSNLYSCLRDILYPNWSWSDMHLQQIRSECTPGCY